jgi:hypothetical protein
MKFTQYFFFFLTIAVLLFADEIRSQSNLITKNPDFIEDNDGWTNSGNSLLYHISEGALTPGAAKLEVTVSSDNYSKARLKSSRFELPSMYREKLLILTFYAKSLQKGSFRVSFKAYDSNGESTVYNSKSYVSDTAFRKYYMTIYFENFTTEFSIDMYCGKTQGTYIFDDFYFTFREESTNDITLSEEWTPRTFQEPDEIEWQTPGTGYAPVKIVVKPTDSLAPVLGTQFGVNSNFRSKNSIVNRVNLYKEMGSFRYPAGSGSNQYFFDCNIPDTFAIDVDTYCGTSNKFTDPEHYVQFLSEAGGEGTVVVNYFYARYGITPEGTRKARVSQAAGYAASFVRKMNIELGAGIKYWEVGNECNGSWETGYDVNGSIVTGKEYGEDLRVFADSMKNVDPDIKIGAVMSPGDFDWNAQVIQEVKDDVDFLIIHHYFKDVESAELSQKQLISLENDMIEMELLVSEYTDKPGGYFPMALTEFNIQGEHTTTIINGLFTADALVAIVKNHYSLSTIWVNEWRIDEYNVTHGILSLEDPDQPDYTARPVYTPYYYYGKCFGDRLVGSTVFGSNDIHANASLFSSGEIGLSVINYSGIDQKITFDLGTPGADDTLYLYSVYADNQIPGNKKFYVNGYTGDTPGGGPVDLDEVPAVAMKWTDTSVLTVPKYSVNFIVIKRNGGFVGIMEEKDTWHHLKIYPNPASAEVIIEAGKDQGKIKVYNINGMEITGKVSVKRKAFEKTSIDISKLPAGIYVVKSEHSIGRFIKE